MMGRQGNDSAVVHSSIALLQERFRQLQRAKEMREERELLRGFAVAADTEPQPKWFSHPDLLRPSRPLSGPPVHPGERSEFGALETSLSMGLWHNRTAAHSGAETDVDTSLHL